MDEIDHLMSGIAAAEVRLERLCAEAVRLLTTPRNERDATAFAALAGAAMNGRAELTRLTNGPAAMAFTGPTPGQPDTYPMASMRRAEAQLRLAGVHRRASIWQRVGEMAHELAEDRRVPLFPDPGAIDDLWFEQFGAFERLLGAFHKLANPNAQGDDATAFGCFADIPLSPARFLANIHAASRVARAQRRARPVRFLDVGCGGGTTLLIAAEYFEVSEGLDYDAGYVEAATRMLATVGAGRCRAFQADALGFDGYADYDVIYFYKPMRDAALLRELEYRILDQARPGTILIAPYATFAEAIRDRDCAHLEDHIYIHGLDADGAHALRDEAGHIGVFTRVPQARSSVGTGYLEPLLAALADTGYLR